MEGLKTYTGRKSFLTVLPKHPPSPSHIGLSPSTPFILPLQLATLASPPSDSPSYPPPPHPELIRNKQQTVMCIKGRSDTYKSLLQRWFYEHENHLTGLRGPDGEGGKVGSRRGRSKGAELEGENKRGGGWRGLKPILGGKVFLPYCQSTPPSPSHIGLSPSTPPPLLFTFGHHSSK